MKRTWLIITALTLLALTVLSGCQSTTAEPQTTAAEKTVKIGTVGWFGDPAGLDIKRSIEILADIDNANGGWDIGGEKYKVEIIAYDSNNVQTTEVAAINRLVFEDKVKFIFCESRYINAWLSTTEENKVLVLRSAPDLAEASVIMSPDLHYTFNPSFTNSRISITTGFFCNQYADLVSNYVVALPDNQLGHMLEVITGSTWQLYGAMPTYIFYPPDAQDLSAVGTKIKNLNPTAISAEGGGLSDGLVINATFQAGYEGRVMKTTNDAAEVMAQTMSAQALEGMIMGATTTEFDPAITDLAQDYKEAWIAAYGSWENPDISATASYACLKTALEQAGTADDTDEIVSVIFNGLVFDSPSGAGQMVSRPDIGNENTIDSIGATYIKEIKDGKATLLATISLEEGLTYYEMATSAK